MLVRPDLLALILGRDIRELYLVERRAGREGDHDKVPVRTPAHHQGLVLDHSELRVLPHVVQAHLALLLGEDELAHLPHLVPDVERHDDGPRLQGPRGNDDDVAVDD